MNTRYNTPQIKPFAIIAFLLLSFLLNLSSVSAQDAEKLFKQNCAVCHSLGKNKITGPGLEGIAARAPSDDWLRKWIKNNKELIKSGDPYALKIFAESNGADMTVFTDLKDEEINSLIALIKNPPKEKVAVASAPEAGVAKEEQNGVNPLGILIGIISFSEIFIIDAFLNCIFIFFCTSVWVIVSISCLTSSLTSTVLSTGSLTIDSKILIDKFLQISCFLISNSCMRPSANRSSFPSESSPISF